MSVSRPLDTLTARAFGRERLVLVGRGATAVALALRALGLEGRDVLVPCSVCYAVPFGVELAGCVPVFVDANPSTGNIGVTEVEAAAERSAPAALIAVSALYGPAAPMSSLSAWCDSHAVVLIEDASLSVGSVVEGRPAGGWGAVAFVSTGAGKILDAGGGAVLLADEPGLANELERLVRELPPCPAGLERELTEISLAYRELQWLGRHDPSRAPLQHALFEQHRHAFLHGPPPGLAVAIERDLELLGPRLERRRVAAAAYADALRGLELLTAPDAAALWRFSLLVEDRDTVLQRLWRAGEQASAWYPAIAAAFADRRAYPGAETIGRRILNLWLDGRAAGSARVTAANLVEAL